MALPPWLSSRLSLPVVGSPLFIASGPELVIAQCQAGVIGSFPALNARPAAMLGDWLARITEENAAYRAADPGAIVAPFAVNQIVHRSNERLDHDMAVIVEHEVPIVISSLGAREEINDAVHSYGGVVFHDVINDKFARKAIEKGADGLIAVAAGAGGHAGTQSPFALIQEIRTWFDGPLLLSGAIAHGRSILAAQAAGADLAYIGSAFLSTAEANVVPDYKQMIVDSNAADIVYSNLFTGVHGNYLRGSIIAAGLDPDNLPKSDPSKMNFGSGGNTDAKAWKDVWGAGQGIGAITERRTTAEFVATLTQQYDQARRDLASTLARTGQPAVPSPAAISEVITQPTR
ncbi:nitronate monooxygenase family protein [Nocardia sp. NPDC050710]|uniref:NAD(P)H-dependent flavin oxidoreductase n=1 Tax=Nocardia sp. NPDC050710 TaxID=3157220 RepID=UPI0033C85A25